MKRVPYTYNGSDTVIDETAAPLDGNPVLIKTPGGWIEAYWVPETTPYPGNTEDTDGWYWYSEVTIRGEHWMFDEIEYWAEVPK